ncbi:MAG: hypothetical protein FWG66_06695 [Spirochaetes bacterium]|nr:hypothetical protein [Spirochaetota bacterium]
MEEIFDTGGESAEKRLFLVLVPHRDSRLLLRKYARALFKAGLCGAGLFPSVAPLAVLKRPLKEAELKACARLLRESLLPAGGKISFSKPQPPLRFGFRFALAGRPGLAIFGLGLEVAAGGGFLPPSSVAERLPPLLALGLAPPGESLLGSASLPPAPEISFGAAALANMSFSLAAPPVFCRWKIGRECWLPKKK